MIKCKECIYYRPQVVDNVPLMVCKRYPPQPILDEYHNMLKMRYPATEPDDECGEGVPQKSSEPA
jgi:hypothetical protein